MRKLIKCLALAALLFVPWVTNAQSYEPVPYSTGFEGLSTGTQPSGWTAIQTGVNGSTTFPCAYAYSGNTRTGSVYYEFESSSSSSDTEMVALPYMQNISGLKLTMWVSTSSSYPCTLEVGVLESDNSFTPVDTLSLITFSGSSAWSSNYHEYTTYFADYTGNGERMALRAVRSGSGQFTLFIDDLSVSEDNGCYPLSNLTLVSADSASLTVSWVDDMNASATYTVTYWSGEDDTTVVNLVTDTTYTATGLNTNTIYYFTVTPNCSTGDGLPVSGDFRTQCGQIVLPFSETFEGYTNGQFPPCWQRIRAHNTDPSVNTQYNSTPGGSMSMYLASYNDTTLFVSPTAIPLAGNEIFVSYKAYMYYSSWYSMTKWIKAGVMTNPNDLSTFISLDSVGYHNFNYEFEEREFTTANLDADSTYYVAWIYYCNYSYYNSAGVDDIIIRQDNGCNKPSVAVVDSVGPYNAYLTWTSGGSSATSYDVFYGTQNDFDSTQVVSVSDTTVELTGLLPQTTYYAWVRTACGSDSADAKSFGSFTTQLTCAPLTGVTMGNISYTAAQVEWGYDTTQGFASNGVYITLVDNTDSTVAPVTVEVTGTSYTFSDLAAGHSFTATLRNMCDAPSQTDTAAANTITFMTQSCSEISGTTTQAYIPTYTYYGNSYSQSIYLASEMPSIDTITGIAFNITSRNSGNNEARTFDIYMANIDTNAFDGNNYLAVDSTMLVATGKVFHSNQTGWQVVPFDSTFVYDNTKNLLLVVNDKTGAYGSSCQFSSISASGRAISSYRDGASNQYDPSTITTGTTRSAIPAVRFVADCEVPQCFAPMLSLDTVDATSISVNWVSVGTESSWVVGYKANNDSVYTFETTSVTDTFYTFTNLSSSTAYEVTVGSLCSEGDTLFATLQATTDCAGGTCNVTVDMVDGYGDGWNGNAIEVYQNGALAGSATISSGSSATATISVCSGTPTEFLFHRGSYPDEISFTVYDGGMGIVYSAAEGDMTNVTNGTVLGNLENACPTCFSPDSLVLTLADSTELEFAWAVVDSVYGYIVQFDTGSWEPALGTYNAFGLTPNTTYTFSVKAVCQIGDTSNARTITVKTACGEMQLPYVEGFENDPAGNMPSCWSSLGTAPENASSNYYTAPHTGAQHLLFEGTGMAISSAVPLNGDSIYVSFWAMLDDYYSTTLEAGVMTNPLDDSTFIPLLTISSTTNAGDYTFYEFNTSSLSAYYDSTLYVAFRHTGSSYAQGYIDDINIRVNEGCMYPANVVVTPGAHDVTLVWDNTSSTMDFVVAHRLTGATAWDTIVYVNDTTYTITGLNAASSYDIAIGFLCNADTLWTNITAVTNCDILSLPYFENFDAYANDVMPPCWGWNTTFCTHWDGGVFFRSYHGGGSEYAVVPQLDGNISKYQIEFDCKVGTPAEQDGILFGVADAGGTLLAWLDTIVDVNHSRNAHVHHILNMLSYTLPAGSARIAFAQLRNWGEWALIDNINITELPECYPVDSLQAYNLIDPDHTTFTWASLGEEVEWQVYVDTVTISIDSIPDSLFTTVSTRSYEIPMGTIQGGGIYTFYVRANCGADQSTWNSYTFGAGTVIMNNSATADTVVACGLVVYDNGGPIAGYLPNSNSALVIRSENAGSELQLFGAKFGIGSSGATLTVYDGEGTTGSVLYTYNTTDGRDTLLNTNLATSTTGALTITFVANGSMCHTGYELYIHCVGAALCERPTQLNAVMTEIGEAHVTWHGTSAAYDLYYKPTGATNWTIQSTTADSLDLTGLIPDTTYDMQVVGICGTDTSTPSFPIVLNTHYDVVITPCNPISGLTVSDVTNNSATLSWTSAGSQWEIEITRIGAVDTIVTNTNPYTLTGLLPNMNYSVRVRTACSGVHVDPYSDWSAAETFTTPLDGPQSYTLTVVSNNDAWGTVTGGGTYVEGTTVTLTATANDGYYFDRWNDGNTDSVRTVTVTADASYTAFFAENGTQNTYYTVSVSSNNNDWGTVSGGGDYIENSTATITATANDGYHFVEWNDGVTDAIRTFTVIENVNFVATFAANTGIDDVDSYTMSVFPNPASSTVTVSFEGIEGQVRVEIVDISGRTVASETTSEGRTTIDVSRLSQGAYFVRVTGEQATAVSRLIVK